MFTKKIISNIFLALPLLMVMSLCAAPILMSLNGIESVVVSLIALISLLMFKLEGNKSDSH